MVKMICFVNVSEIGLDTELGIFLGLKMSQEISWFYSTPEKFLGISCYNREISWDFLL